MLKTVALWVSMCLAVTSLVIFLGPLTHADTSSSAHYTLFETSFGADTGGSSTSASYSATQSVGNEAVGNEASTTFRTQAGSVTTNDPALGFSLSNGAVAFGNLSATTPTQTSTTFSVIDYTSYGYTVQITGATPSNGSHVIPGMSTTASSSVGVEQFGMNLVANTAPTSIGANPNNGGFGYGVASANYSTPNQYRYVAGETIASAPKSSGVTTYTISYLLNVASLTPGGQYTSNQTLVITGTY
jgi:hypothetical protein